MLLMPISEALREVLMLRIAFDVRPLNPKIKTAFAGPA